MMRPPSREDVQQAQSHLVTCFNLFQLKKHRLKLLGPEEVLLKSKMRQRRQSQDGDRTRRSRGRGVTWALGPGWNSFFSCCRAGSMEIPFIPLIYFLLV